jgi:hypothetical protein
MEKLKYKFWYSYLATALLIYLNGSFVNASFDIHYWPLESRQLYGLAFYTASIILGGCLFFAGIDIKDEAEKLAKQKEGTKIKTH